MTAPISAAAFVGRTLLFWALLGCWAAHPIRAQQDEPSAASQTESTPASADCAWLPRLHPSPRERWHELSAGAERLVRSIPSHAVTAPGASGVMLHSRSFVDTEIFEKLVSAGVRPTALASDEEFLRRVSVDLTGQIPDAATVRSFLADTQPGKRDRIIDRLLASDAFVERWALWFGDLIDNVKFATNASETYYGRNVYSQWIADAIKSGKPYDQMVRELISGAGDSFAQGTPNYWVRQMQNNGPIQDTYDNLSAHTGEKFLAVQLVCLSCHNGAGHTDAINIYLSSKSRMDFWKNAAFFARTASAAVLDPAYGQTRKYVISENITGSYKLNTISGNKSPRQPAVGQSATVNPSFILTGEEPRAGESPRDAYGRMLTGHPQFARAAVNSLWKELFGLGIVEPSDSFDLLRLDPNAPPPGEWTIQPTHPVLLNKLATAFQASGYNLRSILGTMVRSYAYQLSSRYTPGAWNESWAPLFARHLPRRLASEALLDAIARATNVPTPIMPQGMTAVTRAMALPDPTEGGAYSAFLNNFGRGNRDGTPRSNDGSIVQALAMLDDPIVTTRVKQLTLGSTVRTILAATSVPETIADELYLATLGRHPSAAESGAAALALKSGTLSAKTEDLQFALLNRLEFLFN